MSRKEDEDRVMQAFKRATLNYSEGSRAVGTVVEVVALIEEVRHETIARCWEAMNGAINSVSNAAMTPERMRRMLGTPVQSDGGSDG
jgi:hypothetical protein